MKLLIMGLPGSGKTTLARILAERFLMPHVNADTLREFYNDWDFSKEGRLMQAHRMSQRNPQWGSAHHRCSAFLQPIVQRYQQVCQ